MKVYSFGRVQKAIIANTANNWQQEECPSIFVLPNFGGSGSEFGGHFGTLIISVMNQFKFSL